MIWFAKLTPPLHKQILIISTFNSLFSMRIQGCHRKLLFFYYILALCALLFSCYNVANKGTHFVRITLFSYTNSCMFMALLAQHQEVHNCVRQSSDPSSFSRCISRPVFTHGPLGPGPRAANFQGRHIKKIEIEVWYAEKKGCPRQRYIPVWNKWV